MTNLKPEFINFAEHVINALSFNAPPPGVLERLFEEYKKGNYIRKPGLIWLNYTVASFFEEEPDELRSVTREDKISYPRQVAMYFANFYNHKRGNIAKFYSCTGGNVTYAINKIEKILNNKENFTERKILAILKYELL